MNWSVTGHDEQKAYLERLIAVSRLPHALLFTGPDGVGKRSMAEDLLGELVPPSLAVFDAMRLSPIPDEDGAVTDVSVESVRAMRSWMAMRPAGSRKVVLMDSVERLNAESANTLLKVLEEPPAYAHFLLMTGNPAGVLPTVSSRCQRLDFRPLSDAEMKLVLGKRKLDDDDRALLAVLAGGRPAAALAMLDGGELATAAKEIAALQDALKGGDSERIALAKRITDSERAAQVCGWWIAYTRSRLADKPHLAPLVHGLLELQPLVSQSQFNTKLALEHFLLSA
jgi:DNA polymerase-3 subunit delta'